jgi:hypothetical protein
MVIWKIKIYIFISKSLILKQNEKVVSYKVVDITKYDNFGLYCFSIRGHLKILKKLISNDW